MSPSPAAQTTTGTKTATSGLGSAVQLSLVRVTAVSKLANVVSENPLEKPRAGNQFFALEVRYEATGNQKVSYSPFSDWKIRDFTGHEYPASYVSGKAPELQSGDLASGDKAQGWITFEIPAGAAGLTAVVKIGNDVAAFSL